MKWIESLKTYLKKYKGPAKLLNLYTLSNGYLGSKGWLESTYKRESLNEKNEPIPWISYSMLSLLEQRIDKSHSVFEFGSGNSTIWFAKKAKSIISVEHDKGYFEYVTGRLNHFDNVEYHFASLGDSYTNMILEVGNKFDIIVIDGRERVICAKNSIKALTPRGVIIWDNADRDKYIKGYAFLKSAGFKRIDFYGLAPMAFKDTCTAVFYRDDNCFNI